MCRIKKKNIFKILALLIAFLLCFLCILKIKEIRKSAKLNTALKEALLKRETVLLSDIMITTDNTRFALLGPYQPLNKIVCSDHPLINPYLNSTLFNEDKCRLITFNTFTVLDIVTIDDELIASTFQRLCFPSKEIYLIPQIENGIPVSFRLTTLEEIKDKAFDKISSQLKAALKEGEAIWLKDIVPYDEDNLIFFLPPHMEITQIEFQNINTNKIKDLDIPVSRDEDVVRLVILDKDLNIIEIINFYGSYESPLYYNEPGCFRLKDLLLIPDFKMGNPYLKMINKELL